MAGRALYLHETVDIVGQGQYDYMDHAGREPTNAMPRMLTLQGTFFVCAMGGGRWPQVINIWDVGEGGWDAWAANVDRLNLKRRRAFYGAWWDDAAEWRTGGFDRLCGGGPGSPTTAEIAARGVKGSLFLHEVLTVRPGTQLEYLAAVEAERVPLMREHGCEPTGLYEVLSNGHEVVCVWATTISAHTGYRRARDAAHGLDDGVAADGRILAWERRSAEWVSGGDLHLMTPQPGTVYGPDDWEDANLEQWMGDAATGDES